MKAAAKWINKFPYAEPCKADAQSSPCEKVEGQSWNVLGIRTWDLS